MLHMSGEVIYMLQKTGMWPRVNAFFQDHMEHLEKRFDNMVGHV